MKKVILSVALAFVAVVSFAGSIQFTTSCGDTYIIEYRDGMTASELVDRLLLLDAALC